jgi:hypothetical protein
MTPVDSIIMRAASVKTFRLLVVMEQSFLYRHVDIAAHPGAPASKAHLTWSCILNCTNAAWARYLSPAARNIFR